MSAGALSIGHLARPDQLALVVVARVKWAMQYSPKESDQLTMGATLSGIAPDVGHIPGRPRRVAHNDCDEFMGV